MHSVDERAIAHRIILQHSLILKQPEQPGFKLKVPSEFTTDAYWVNRGMRPKKELDY